jgi:hypothetical protein
MNSVSSPELTIPANWIRAATAVTPAVARTLPMTSSTRKSSLSGVDTTFSK